MVTLKLRKFPQSNDPQALNYPFKGLLLSFGVCVEEGMDLYL